MTNDFMIEFYIYPTHERILMRVSAMMCLFPEQRQIRTTESGWTVTVEATDWERVEKAFRNAYLGNKIRATGQEHCLDLRPL
jgi:pyridoxine 5'-phosphate synthase PdxJ